MRNIKALMKIKNSVKIALRTFCALIFTAVFCVVLSGCSGSGNVDITERRAAALHAEGQAFSISNIETPSHLALELEAAQAFVYDMQNEKYLYLLGADKILYPASTTKLLTALYALEILSPDELVTPGDELDMKNEQSAIAFIKKHHTLSVEMLIEAMLLPSGGDAAYALAAAGGRRLSEGEISASLAVELFVAGMNEYASVLGLCGSSFTSPDGFYDPENFSTIEDMAILSQAASKNEIIMKYASLPSASVVYASGHTNSWLNTNRMLHKESEYYSPYVTGLKTGTLEGNSCLICTLNIDGKNYIAGVFSVKSENGRYDDMQKIIEFCKER
ncbi:MAG: D-alanyl-D-alanine carboxypeptidase [Clostridia bacterium]|nr:D-alanyl-D-alanine carboxypeptidase [Clostridia bacterium]